MMPETAAQSVPSPRIAPMVATPALRVDLEKDEAWVATMMTAIAAAG